MYVCCSYFLFLVVCVVALSIVVNACSYFFSLFSTTVNLYQDLNHLGLSFVDLTYACIKSTVIRLMQWPISVWNYVAKRLHSILGCYNMIWLPDTIVIRGICPLPTDPTPKKQDEYLTCFDWLWTGFQMFSYSKHINQPNIDDLFLAISMC